LESIGITIFFTFPFWIGGAIAIKFWNWSSLLWLLAGTVAMLLWIGFILLIVPTDLSSA